MEAVQARNEWLEGRVHTLEARVRTLEDILRSHGVRVEEDTEDFALFGASELASPSGGDTAGLRTADGQTRSAEAPVAEPRSTHTHTSTDAVIQPGFTGTTDDALVAQRPRADSTNIKIDTANGARGAIQTRKSPSASPSRGRPATHTRALHTRTQTHTPTSTQAQTRVRSGTRTSTGATPPTSSGATPGFRSRLPSPPSARVARPPGGSTSRQASPAKKQVAPVRTGAHAHTRVEARTTADDAEGADGFPLADRTLPGAVGFQDTFITQSSFLGTRVSPRAASVPAVAQPAASSSSAAGKPVDDVAVPTRITRSAGNSPRASPTSAGGGTRAVLSAASSGKYRVADGATVSRVQASAVAARLDRDAVASPPSRGPSSPTARKVVSAQRRAPAGRPSKSPIPTSTTGSHGRGNTDQASRMSAAVRATVVPAAADGAREHALVTLRLLSNSTKAVLEACAAPTVRPVVHAMLSRWRKLSHLAGASANRNPFANYDALLTFDDEQAAIAAASRPVHDSLSGSPATTRVQPRGGAAAARSALIDGDADGVAAPPLRSKVYAPSDEDAVTPASRGLALRQAPQAAGEGSGTDTDDDDAIVLGGGAAGDPMLSTFPALLRRPVAVDKHALAVVTTRPPQHKLRLRHVHGFSGIVGRPCLHVVSSGDVRAVAGQPTSVKMSYSAGAIAVVVDAARQRSVVDAAMERMLDGASEDAAGDVLSGLGSASMTTRQSWSLPASPTGAAARPPLVPGGAVPLDGAEIALRNPLFKRARSRASSAPSVDPAESVGAPGDALPRADSASDGESSPVPTVTDAQTQTFYNGHTGTITAMASHPWLPVMVSAALPVERTDPVALDPHRRFASCSAAVMHMWDARHRVRVAEPVLIPPQLGHVVIGLGFSACGRYLLALVAAQSPPHVPSASASVHLLVYDAAGLPCPDAAREECAAEDADTLPGTGIGSPVATLALEEVVGRVPPGSTMSLLTPGPGAVHADLLNGLDTSASPVPSAFILCADRAVAVYLDRDAAASAIAVASTAPTSNSDWRRYFTRPETIALRAAVVELPVAADPSESLTGPAMATSGAVIATRPARRAAADAANVGSSYSIYAGFGCSDGTIVVLRGEHLVVRAKISDTPVLAVDLLEAGEAPGSADASEDKHSPEILVTAATIDGEIHVIYLRDAMRGPVVRLDASASTKGLVRATDTIIAVRAAWCADVSAGGDPASARQLMIVAGSAEGAICRLRFPSYTPPAAVTADDVSPENRADAVAVLDAGSPGGATCVCAHPYLPLYVVGTAYGCVQLWSALSGTRLAEVRASPPVAQAEAPIAGDDAGRPVTSVDIAPDGATIVATFAGMTHRAAAKHEHFSVARDRSVAAPSSPSRREGRPSILERTKPGSATAPSLFDAVGQASGYCCIRLRIPAAYIQRLVAAHPRYSEAASRYLNVCDRLQKLRVARRGHPGTRTLGTRKNAAGAASRRTEPTANDVLAVVHVVAQAHRAATAECVRFAPFSSLATSASSILITGTAAGRHVPPGPAENAAGNDVELDSVSQIVMFAVGWSDGVVDLYTFDTSDPSLDTAVRRRKTLKVPPACLAAAAAAATAEVRVAVGSPGDKDIPRPDLPTPGAAILRLDWDTTARFVQGCTSTYELFCWDAATGQGVKSLAVTRELGWCSQTCMLGWPVLGVWQLQPANERKQRVAAHTRARAAHNGGSWTVVPTLACARNRTGSDVILTGSADGILRVFSYPAHIPGAAHARHYAHAGPLSGVDFLAGDEGVVTVGANDGIVMDWAFDWDLESVTRAHGIVDNRAAAAAQLRRLAFSRRASTAESSQAVVPRSFADLLVQHAAMRQQTTATQAPRGSVGPSFHAVRAGASPARANPSSSPASSSPARARANARKEMHSNSAEAAAQIPASMPRSPPGPPPRPAPPTAFSHASATIRLSASVPTPVSEQPAVLMYQQHTALDGALRKPVREQSMLRPSVGAPAPAAPPLDVAEFHGAATAVAIGSFEDTSTSDSDATRPPATLPAQREQATTNGRANSSAVAVRPVGHLPAPGAHQGTLSMDLGVMIASSHMAAAGIEMPPPLPASPYDPGTGRSDATDSTPVGGCSAEKLGLERFDGTRSPGSATDSIGSTPVAANAATDAADSTLSVAEIAQARYQESLKRIEQRIAAQTRWIDKEIQDEKTADVRRSLVQGYGLPKAASMRLARGVKATSTGGLPSAAHRRTRTAGHSTSSGEESPTVNSRVRRVDEDGEESDSDT